MKTPDLLLVVLLFILGTSWCLAASIEGADEAQSGVVPHGQQIKSRTKRSPLAIFSGILPIFSFIVEIFTNHHHGMDTKTVKDSVANLQHKVNDLISNVREFTTKLSHLETTMESEFSELKDKLDTTQGTCRDLKGLIEHSSMWHKQIAIFGRDVQRLQYLLMVLNERLERDDLGQVKVNAESNDWASAVLSKRDDGVDQILMNMHHMITGKSPVFLAASVVKLYFKGLKESDDQRWVKMGRFKELLESMQAAGYVVWATALSITNQTEKINSTVLPLAEERLNRQAEDVFSLYQARLWQWPAGTYGLVKVKDQECPHSRWETGWREHDTMSSIPTHSISVHMAVTHNRYLMKWEFCMKTATVHDAEFDWPAGTYCIFSKNGVAKNFQQGWIFWDDDDSNAKSGILPDGLYIESDPDSTKINFSCRHDKPAEEPIQLPIQQPFFLFPLHGYMQDIPCQKVEGMTATEEWYQWKSASKNNGNKFEWPHPKKSGPRNQITLHACYYEPIV